MIFLKIYLDILIITNALVTFVYLQCIKRIMHEGINSRREAVACAVGGVGSLLAMAESESFFTALLITLGKLAAVCLVVAIAFRPSDFYGFVKRIFLYGLCEVMTGGACLLLVNVLHRRVIYMKNYIIYFDITLLQLAVCCSSVYVAILIYETVQRRRCDTVKRYRATYIIGKYELTLPAVADTGNKLCDCFTGAPVVIFRSDELYERFDLDRAERLNFHGFHPVPFETINGTGIILVTSKGKVKISGKDTEKYVSCCVGVLPQQGSSYAVFDPLLLV